MPRFIQSEKMIWITLFSFFSCLCGILSLATIPTVYQAEEGDSCTIRWDVQAQSDMSLANMACFFHSDPLKVLYEMIDGVEISKSRDQQFVGRVVCDRHAFREGRVRLHLSRLTAEDSGYYWCELVANYDEISRRWELETSANFILNVTQTSHEEIYMSPDMPKSGLEGSEDKKQPLKRSLGVKLGMAAAALAVIALVGHVAVTVFHDRKSKDQLKDKDALIDLLIKINKEFHHKDSSS